jgi:hypothetical protein
MLTIDNIHKLEGAILPNEYQIEKITTGTNVYIFQMGRHVVIYNPYTFQPETRNSNKTFVLNRYLDELNPFYMLTDEMGKYTWVNKDSLKDTQSFIAKLNELTTLWK